MKMLCVYVNELGPVAFEYRAQCATGPSLYNICSFISEDYHSYTN